MSLCCSRGCRAGAVLVLHVRSLLVALLRAVVAKPRRGRRLEKGRLTGLRDSTLLGCGAPVDRRDGVSRHFVPGALPVLGHLRCEFGANVVGQQVTAGLDCRSHLDIEVGQASDVAGGGRSSVGSTVASRAPLRASASARLRPSSQARVSSLRPH